MLNVRELREMANISQQALANKTGIPKDRIAKWEQGKGAPKSADEKTLIKFFREYVPHENQENQVLEEPDAAHSYQKRRLDLKNNKGKRQIPFYDAPATATLTETEMTPIHAPAGTIDVGDLLHDSQAAIRIYGNSMLPNYPPGCVVGLVKLSSMTIEPGEVYVIETADRRILKRLFYKDDDYGSDQLLLYSDNIMVFEGGSRHGKPAYPPRLMHKKEIINLYAVTGVIKRNSNSVIINR